MQEECVHDASRGKPEARRCMHCFESCIMSSNDKTTLSSNPATSDLDGGKRALVGWKGYIPAITTPFAKDGALDLPAFGKLLEWLESEGMHGLVLAGTTGEWSVMTPEERIAVFKAAGSQLGGRVPLIAGCSAFTPSDVVRYAIGASEAGCEGILVTPPPYLRPNNRELLEFYKAVAHGSPLPVCIYNWPPGTGIDLDLDLIDELADVPNIVAIKQSTSVLGQFVATFFRVRDRIRVFGHSMDEHGLALLQARGGDGTMGAGAVLGRIHADFYNHLWAGEIEEARLCGQKDRAILERWYHKDLTGRFGSGPAIMKAALNEQGLPGGYVRAPLIDVDAAGREEIRASLQDVGLL